MEMIGENDRWKRTMGTVECLANRICGVLSIEKHLLSRRESKAISTLNELKCFIEWSSWR